MKKKGLVELDFLMIYEHKVRELENLCLLKYELEKRGYRVKILHIEDTEAAKAVKPIYHAKVVVLMACYRNSTLEWHTKEYVKFEKVIDMQWENIVYPKDENASGVFKNYSGIGKEVARVSWGNANRKRLLETVHMDPKKIMLIGHVGMDFLRDDLKGYYLTKAELFRQYNLPLNKKILLFASPYYSDSLSEGYIADMCSRFGEEWKDYYMFMIKSEKIILKWMEDLCMSREDLFVIYRPHPGHPGERVTKVAAKCKNFKIINDLSIKQWILCSDILYTGNSSTLVEAFFAKKPCCLLFPYEVTEGFELKLIQNSKKIKSYQDFCRSVDMVNIEFPVRQQDINEIYAIDWEIPSYIKFANMAEEIIKDPYFTLTKQQLKAYRSKKPWHIKLQKQLAKIEFLYNIYIKLLSNEEIHGKWIDRQRVRRKKVDEIAEKLKNESTSEEEIDHIIAKIQEQLK